MNGLERTPSQSQDPAAEGREPAGPVRLVPFQGEVPEQLVGFFRRLNSWTWRDLRTVFCHFPETRRLVNILRTIDLVLEKAPHTLARGHWSIAGYRDARRKLENAIAKLGQLSNQVAADARVRLPVLPARPERAFPAKPRAAFQLVRTPTGVFQKRIEVVKENFAARSSEAA
jgi:hypothetical protein